MYLTRLQTSNGSRRGGTIGRSNNNIAVLYNVRILCQQIIYNAASRSVQILFPHAAYAAHAALPHTSLPEIAGHING